MTENERVLRDIIIDGNGFDYDESIPQSIFEEIQQYREIGTVEKIKEELDRLRNDNECQGLYFTLEERKALAKQSRELSEYKAIGTIEEFKALKEDSRFLEFLYNRILPNEMERYLSMYKSSDTKTNGE